MSPWQMTHNLSAKVELFGVTYEIPARKKLKIAFFAVAPFIVKFRFEKYRYLLTHLLCLQIFEVLLSDKHSTGPQNGRLVPLPVACLVWWYSFRPQIYDESETDQILNAKYFVWKNYTLGKWGTRKAFNPNSLMQLFNGDRRIVHWFTSNVIALVSFSNDKSEADIRTRRLKVGPGWLLKVGWF